MQCVLAPIDPNGADNSDVFLAGHGVLLVLFKLPAQADPVSCSGRSTAVPSHSRQLLRRGDMSGVGCKPEVSDNVDQSDPD